MTFIERENNESLAMHLHRNADALGVSPQQRRALREAAALSLGDSRQRAQAGRMAERVRNELAADLEAVLAAARARREAVTDARRSKAKRVVDRDGLAQMFERGQISEAQFNVGLLYRRLLEATEAEVLGSQLGRVGETRIPAKSTDGACAQGLLRAYAGVRVRDVEESVRAADPSGLSLVVLRAIAGEGRTLRSPATGGNGYALRLKAIRLGLDTAAKRLTATSGRAGASLWGLRITAR